MDKFKGTICGEEIKLATNEEFDDLSFENDLKKIGCPKCHCFTHGREPWNFTIICKNVMMRISKLVAHGMVEDKLLSYAKRVKDLGKVMNKFDDTLFPPPT